MTQARLEYTLRSMVRRYGFEQVNESLQEIGNAEFCSEESNHTAAQPTKIVGAQADKRIPKSTASQYVAKMDLPTDKRESVVDLAQRFDDKSFLPTTGDIANFCQIYKLDVPASKSRVSAIPRVFKHIASMETDGIQRILEEGLFSGPSRLGPIADAIRRNGRAKFVPNSGTPVSDNS